MKSFFSVSFRRGGLGFLCLAAILAAGLTGCAPSPESSSSTASPSDHREVTGTDLEGGFVQPLRNSGTRGTVLLFVATDCPISNRYAPTIQQLFADFSKASFRFWLVYPDPDTTADEVRSHRSDFQLPMEALLDPEQALVRVAGAEVTPEAAVFDSSGNLLYRGRIDNRFVDFGKERPRPTRNDLREVLAALEDGRPSPVQFTKAVGCYIPPLEQ